MHQSLINALFFYCKNFNCRSMWPSTKLSGLHCAPLCCCCGSTQSTIFCGPPSTLRATLYLPRCNSPTETAPEPGPSWLIKHLQRPPLIYEPTDHLKRNLQTGGAMCSRANHTHPPPTPETGHPGFLFSSSTEPLRNYTMLGGRSNKPPE